MDSPPPRTAIYRLLLCLSVLILGTAFASPTTTLTLDPPHLTTAERTTLTLTASAPPGSIIELPEVFTELGGFTIRAKNISPPKLGANGQTLTSILTLKLEPLLPGHYQIPALTTSFTQADGTTTESISPIITSTVTSLLPPITEGLEPRSAAPPATDLRRFLAPAALALLASTIILSYRRWKQNKRLIVSASDPTSSILARLETDEPHLLTREYLQSRFGIDPLPNAPHEILAQLDLPEESADVLSELLQKLDHNEFAQSPLPKNDSRPLLKKFIHLTTTAE